MCAVTVGGRAASPRRFAEAVHSHQRPGHGCSHRQVAAACGNADAPAPALIVVRFSYNAGKSALVNAIIGEALLTSAPVEQTTVPWAVIREGTFPDLTVSQVVPNVVWTTAANAFPSLVLVDTPGYGGVDADKITLAPLIDIAQVAVLCISSQTPVTMYDVRMAEMLVRKKLRVLVVLTKADLCVDDAERSAVIASVRKRLSPALSHCPHVWAVSTSSSSKSSYELVTLTAELASLQDRSWLSKALLETVHWLCQPSCPFLTLMVRRRYERWNVNMTRPATRFVRGAIAPMKTFAPCVRESTRSTVPAMG